MDLQFFGANCLSLTHKSARIVIDDNLAELGAKSITKSDDVVLYSGPHAQASARLVLDGPGEYEVAEVSIIGVRARAHSDEPGQASATMFKLVVGEQSLLVTGHIYPDLKESQLEAIGLVDILAVPVGGHGYTVDPTGALKLIKAIEPKIVIPTHYADKSLKFPVPQEELSTALNEMGMEPKETLGRLRYKPSEVSDVTQLVILERS